MGLAEFCCYETHPVATLAQAKKALHPDTVGVILVLGLPVLRSPFFHINALADLYNTSVEYLTGQTDDDAPIVYTVNKRSNDQLFYIVDVYQKSDHQTKDQIYEYCKKLRVSKLTSKI